MSAIDVPDRYVDRVDELDEVRTVLKSGMRPMLSSVYRWSWLLHSVRRPIKRIDRRAITLANRDPYITYNGEDWIPYDVYIHAPDGTVSLINASDGTTIPCRLVVSPILATASGVSTAVPSHVVVPAPAPTASGNWMIHGSNGLWYIPDRLARWLKIILKDPIHNAILDLWQTNGASSANDAYNWTIRFMGTPDTFGELDSWLSLLAGYPVFDARDGKILEAGISEVRTEATVYTAPNSSAPRTTYQPGDTSVAGAPVFDAIMLVDEKTEPGWWKPSSQTNGRPIIVPDALMPGSSSWIRSIDDAPRLTLWESSPPRHAIQVDNATISASGISSSNTWILGAWVYVQGSGTIAQCGGATLTVSVNGDLDINGNSAGSLTMDTWTHVAVSWDGATGGLWINGQKTTASWAGGTTITSLIIGPFAGLVTDVWIEDGVSEIPYPEAITMGAKRPGALLHWSFDHVYGSHIEGQSFSGSSYIAIDGPGLHSFDDHGWVGMWLRIPTGAPDGMVIMSVADKTQSTTLTYKATTSTLESKYSGDPSGQESPITLDTWHHVAWQMRSSTIDPDASVVWSPSSIWFRDFSEANLHIAFGASVSWDGVQWVYSNHATCDIAYAGIWRGTPQQAPMSRRSDPRLATLMMGDAVTAPLLSGLVSGLPLSEAEVVQDISGSPYYNAKIDGQYMVTDITAYPDDMTVEAWGIGDPDLVIGATSGTRYMVTHDTSVTDASGDALMPGGTIQLTQSDTSTITATITQVYEHGRVFEATLTGGTPITGPVTWTDTHGTEHSGVLTIATPTISSYAYRVMDKVWKHTTFAVRIKTTGIPDETKKVIDAVSSSMKAAHTYYFGRLE